MTVAIMEVLRYSTMSSISVAHSPIRDGLTLRGYNIPRYSSLWANFYAVHFDKDVFPEPYKFQLEHFLSKDNEIINREHLMPFGVGKSVLSY